ncbi:MAG: hypothetical protein VX519_00055 [Myxococcota bacterium]|nr:hypothetical protein [Myxococcota bacterium]
MSKKGKGKGKGKSQEDLFETHEDDFFAAGDSDDFWTDEFGEDAVSAAKEALGLDDLEDEGVPGDENPDEGVDEVEAALLLKSAPTEDEIAQALEEAAEPEDEPVAIEEEPAAEAEPEAEPEPEPVAAAEVAPEIEQEADAPALSLSGGSLPEADTGLVTEALQVEKPERVAYTASADETERWSRIVDVLSEEANEVDAAEAGPMLVAAARIALDRLGDFEAAESLASRAVELEPESGEALAVLAAALGDLERWEEMRSAMERCATAEKEDGIAAEYLQDAALLTRRHLADEAGAQAMLEQSLQRNADDYLSLQLLRDVLRSVGDSEVSATTLERMASLTGGARAAGYHYERGRLLLEELERPEEGIQAFWAARKADKSHVPAFLALQSLLKRGARWVDLAKLYESEAQSSEGGDAWFWYAQSAQIYGTHTGDDEAAIRGYRNAIGAGAGSEVRRELQVLLANASRWGDLALELEGEIEGLTGEAQAHARYRLAQVLEAEGNTERALSLYKEVASDPNAKPASEAVSRLLQARGDYEGLLEHWEKRLHLLQEPHLKVSLEFRMGEICETLLGDTARARGYYEAILDISPGYLPALEALERVYTHNETWDKLAAVYEQRGILSEEPTGKALQFHRSGAVWEFRLGNQEKAREFYRRALDHVADFPPSLDAFQRILETEQQWSGLAQLLCEAAEACQDGNEKVSLLYRAGRVQADKVGDSDTAAEILRRCLELSPGFIPALTLLKELDMASASWAEVRELMLQEADTVEEPGRRHWLLLAAASAGERLEDVDSRSIVQKVIDEAPEHPGALQALEMGAIRAQDDTALSEIYRTAASQAGEVGARNQLHTMLLRSLIRSDSNAQVGEVLDRLLQDEGSERPLGVMALLAESVGLSDSAVAAAEQNGDTFQVARIREHYLGDAEGALAGYNAVLEQDPAHEGALSGSLRIYQQLGDVPAVARVHLALAEISDNASVQAVHANLAGNRFEAAGLPEEAVRAYRVAFDASPVRGKALDALRRLLVQLGDSDSIRALHADRERENRLELTEDLLFANDPQGAIEALGDARDLVSLAMREAALEDAGDWKGVHENLKVRKSVLQSEEARRGCEAKKRWLLAEKLEDTEEAWEYYSSLHESEPDDVEVLESLAQIAGARGEPKLALQYLEGLVGLAEDAEVIARYQRRIAKVHRISGDYDSASNAYLKALDHMAEDEESLVGLREIGEIQQDWAGVVGILAREAALATGQAQMEIYERIAKTWEELIGDLAVATESWRRVLELDPGHRPALERLVSLTDQLGDHSGFVFHGNKLIDLVDDEERVRLQRRVGICYAEQLNQQAEALPFLTAATEGDAPDLEAARALVRLYEDRQEWTGVVDALRRESRAVSGLEGAAPLLKAVKITTRELRARGNVAELYEEVLACESDNTEALEYLSEHRYAEGDAAGAVELFTRLERQASDWDLEDFDVQIEACRFYFHFASALIKLGDYKPAQARLEKALALNGNHLPSLKAIGPVYMEQEEWVVAERIYRQLLQLIGGSGQAEELGQTYGCLGLVEWHLNKHEKARKRFTKALELSPNNVGALRGMGRVLYGDEDWKGLLNVYNNVIKVAREPQAIIEAYLVKGHVLDAKMGLPDKAAQHYEKARHYRLKLPEDEALPVQVVDQLAERSLLRLGEISLRREEWPLACSLADEGLALSSEDKRVKALLRMVSAISQVGLQDMDSAQEQMGEAFVLDPGLADGMRDEPLANLDRMQQALRSRVQVSPF